MLQWNPVALSYLDVFTPTQHFRRLISRVWRASRDSVHYHERNHTSEFFSFTKPGQKAKLRQNPSAGLRTEHELAWESVRLNGWCLLKSSAAKGITAWSNNVCNLIEHQSILITAMLTNPSGGGWWGGGDKDKSPEKVLCVYVCVYLTLRVESGERICTVPQRVAENASAGGRRYWKRVCCASFFLSFFFFYCLCAETWPNGNRCYSLRPNGAEAKEKGRVREIKRMSERGR